MRTHFLSRFVFLLITASLLIGSAAFVQAQGAGSQLDEVYVTTQYNAILRDGPGVLFNPLATIPFATTMRATGRIWNGEWIQVTYSEQSGWVAYWLLNWTGNILELPVEGEVVVTPELARRAGPLIAITPETRYYRDGIHPDTLVENTLTETVVVEVTGRVGSAESGYFWIQFSLNGEFYWTASWEVGVPRGYSRTPDGSYLYAYGRLLSRLRAEISRSSSVLGYIAGRWIDLDSGFSVSCNNIPENIAVDQSRLRDGDLELEAEYVPALRALEEANASINQALALFRDVCARQGENRVINPEEVQTGLGYVDVAAQGLVLADTLLPPLARRDPLLGNTPQEN
ncbi:MAG: hypothetical protein SF029_05560 [bacterium]|nr:hypothetical protein [bacterium]